MRSWGCINDSTAATAQGDAYVVNASIAIDGELRRRAGFSAFQQLAVFPTGVALFRNGDGIEYVMSISSTGVFESVQT
jgi:hypothetical protein